MGFWDSFLGHAAANAYRDIKKEEKETQKWNDLFHNKLECESAFNEYLKNVGINDTYIGDVEHVNNGSILPIKREIENLRKKVNEYISLGGEGKNIIRLEDIDEEIEKVKYLKKMGCLHRQDEFAALGLLLTQSTLEDELIDSRSTATMIDASNNELSEMNSGDKIELMSTDINQLSGVEFEKVCQNLVENMGFETETTKASGDGGIDLIAYNHQPLLSGKYIIQCKRYAGSVGEPIIRDLYGVITSERANKGILITTGHFTKSAIAFADGKQIELIDGIKLKELFSQYNLSTENTEEIGFIQFLQDKGDNISVDESIDSIGALNEYFGFSSLNEIIRSDTYNYSIRSRMIDLLLQAYLRDDRLSFELPLPQQNYKRCLAQMLREEIGWFYEFADTEDAKIQTLKDFYIIYLAEIELIQGNLFYAYKLYNKALNCKTLQNDNLACKKKETVIVYLSFFETIAMIVMNMCQILSVVGLVDDAKKLANEYAPLIKYQLANADDVYKNNPNNLYGKMQYEWYSNPSSPIAFMLLNYDEYLESDNVEQNLYDQSFFDGLVVDSTLVTYSELQKIHIDGENIVISQITSLDYEGILQNNKEKLKDLIC